MASRKTAVAGKPGIDPTLPNVPLTLNGKTYHLCFDFNGIALAEEMTGMKLLNCIDLQDLSARQYRALLYSALVKESPEITLDEVGSLIKLETLPAITIALVHAWTGSRPEIKVEPGAEDPQAEPLS